MGNYYRLLDAGVGFRTCYAPIWLFGELKILSLRSLRKWQSRKDTLITPPPPLGALLPWKQKTNLPCERYLPCTRKMEDILLPRDVGYSCINKLCYFLAVFYPYSRPPCLVCSSHIFIVSSSTGYISFSFWPLLHIFIFLWRFHAYIKCQ